MQFPATELYITLAISGATLGVYVSKSELIRYRSLILIPFFFVAISWLHLSLRFFSLNDLEKEIQIYYYFTHVVALKLFIASILVLAFLVLISKADDKLPESPR